MKYQVTGNEYVSLPTIREDNGVVEGVSFLYMQHKGMLEMYGNQGLLRPYLSVNGQRQALAPVWNRKHFWVPGFTSRTADVDFSCVYLTPVGERGFLVHLEARNLTGHQLHLTLGAEGSWDSTRHTVNESVELMNGRYCKESGWNHMFVFYQNPGMPLFAFAPIVEDHQPFSDIDQNAVWQCNGFDYDIHRDGCVMPSDSLSLDLFFGIGFEEVAAATSAKEMMRQGYDRLLDRTCRWLGKREKQTDDPVIRERLNTNLFFAFFYATGRTIDTEELCMMTSRSPRYYVSAAYWDRDSLLWAFPAVCETDTVYARELLLSVFARQSRNFGLHSRYIDGTLLEPGFELDELCAPVIALERYIRISHDDRILQEPCIRAGITDILEKLQTKKHPDTELYETFLQPSDDMSHYPYLTYDNVLVWFVLRYLSSVLQDDGLAEKAARCKEAIMKNCVQLYEGKRIFAWSQDLNGLWDIYDEPPGSLQLLPFYGFCDIRDEVWQNTMAVIRNEEYPLSFSGKPIAELGCQHASHPWVLSICNSMLSGSADTAFIHLKRAAMDNGIACESVNEDTGICETGEAFATCAGFLAFSILSAMRA